MVVQGSASVDEGFDVYCGLDVAKSEHHATALGRAGQRLFGKPLPQDEAKLRGLFSGLQQHGKVLLVVASRTRSVPCRFFRDRAANATPFVFMKSDCL
jgi:hypothetical protein